MSMELPSDMPQDLREQMERLAQKNPRLAEVLLRVWRAKQERAKQEEASSCPAPGEDEETWKRTPPQEEASSCPAPGEDEETWKRTPPKMAEKALPRTPEVVAEAEDAPPQAATPDLPAQRARQEWREVRQFEWRDLLEKAEATIARHGFRDVLGPLFPLVRLLVALAIREGARLDPSREAHLFLTQWEVAQALGISERTLERWLNDPRYEEYRQRARLWIAWETWWTSGEGIGLDHAVRGGTVWRVRVRPVIRRRGLRVLAPYLRLPWRDLAQDREEGRTARILSLSDSVSGYKEGLLVGKLVTLRSVVGEPLATPRKTPPLFLDPDTTRGIRELLREASIPRGRNGRRNWVQQVASAIAAALGDQKSLRFWMQVAWAALRQAVWGGGDGAMRLLARVVYVAKEAKEDGFARCPGAYAQALLRREGYWDLVAPFQAYRVGVPV